LESAWVTCPSCQLKHRSRPEGTCPRCGGAIGVAPEGFAPPAPAADASAALPWNGGEAAQASGPEEVNPALRLPGAVLLLNAVLVVAERALVPGLGGDAPGGIGGAGIVSIVIDAALGISLLTGSERYRSLATLRAALGLLVFTGLHLFRGDMVSAVVQLVFSASLLMLLAGTPSGLRRGLGLLGVALCMLLEVAGLYALRTGRDLFGGVFSGAKEVKGGVIEGRKFSYRMNVPGASWRTRRWRSSTRSACSPRRARPTSSSPLAHRELHGPPGRAAAGGAVLHHRVSPGGEGARGVSAPRAPHEQLRGSRGSASPARSPRRTA